MLTSNCEFLKKSEETLLIVTGRRENMNLLWLFMLRKLTISITNHDISDSVSTSDITMLNTWTPLKVMLCYVCYRSILVVSQSVSFVMIENLTLAILNYSLDFLIRTGSSKLSITFAFKWLCSHSSAEACINARKGARNR